MFVRSSWVSEAKREEIAVTEDCLKVNQFDEDPPTCTRTSNGDRGDASAGSGGEVPRMRGTRFRPYWSSRIRTATTHRLAKHITFVLSHGKLALSRIKTLDMSLFAEKESRVQNTLNKIFALVRELIVASKTVKISDVMERCTTKGYKPGQEDACIEE
ncbi:hypothetical protein quinque_014025 [Culex quinquefasciatus]